MKKTVKLTIATAICIMLCGLAAFQLIPSTLLSFFNASPEMLEIGNTALRIISLHFPLAGFAIIAGSVCQAIGNPFYSLIVSVCRQLLVLLPVAWLLAQTGRLGLVWLAFLAAGDRLRDPQRHLPAPHHESRQCLGGGKRAVNSSAIPKQPSRKPGGLLLFMSAFRLFLSCAQMRHSTGPRPVSRTVRSNPAAAASASASS